MTVVMGILTIAAAIYLQEHTSGTWHRAKAKKVEKKKKAKELTKHGDIVDTHSTSILIPTHQAQQLAAAEANKQKQAALAALAQSQTVSKKDKKKKDKGKDKKAAPATAGASVASKDGDTAAAKKADTGAPDVTGAKAGKGVDRGTSSTDASASSTPNTSRKSSSTEAAAKKQKDTSVPKASATKPEPPSMAAIKLKKVQDALKAKSSSSDSSVQKFASVTNNKKNKDVEAGNSSPRSKLKKTMIGMPQVSSQDVIVAAAQKAAADKASKAAAASSSSSSSSSSSDSNVQQFATTTNNKKNKDAETAAESGGWLTGGMAATNWGGATAPSDQDAPVSSMPQSMPSSSNTSPFMQGRSPNPELDAFDEKFSPGTAMPWAPGTPNSNPSYSPTEPSTANAPSSPNSPSRRQSRPPPGLMAGAAPPGLSGGPPGLAPPPTTAASWTASSNLQPSALGQVSAPGSLDAPTAESWNSNFASGGETGSSWLDSGQSQGSAAEKGLWDMPSGPGGGVAGGGFANGMFNAAGGTSLETFSDSAPLGDSVFSASGNAGENSPWGGPDPFGSDLTPAAPGAMGAGAIGSKRDSATAAPGVGGGTVSGISAVAPYFASSDTANIWGNSGTAPFSPPICPFRTFAVSMSVVSDCR